MLRVPRSALRVCPALRTATGLVAVAILALTAGCDNGPPTGKVRGKVTFKGQPVKEGRVTFLNPKEGGTYEALIGSDGSYAISLGVNVGEYVVEITVAVGAMADVVPESVQSQRDCLGHGWIVLDEKDIHHD